jgi:MFS transporter, DHA2 family, multidrug resistance protein
VRRQLTAASPLLPVDLLRIPIFTLSICTSIASFCAQMLAFVALPFYLSDRFAYSGVEIGLLITPWPIAIAFAAPLAGRLVERYPAGLLGGIGLLLFAGGLAMLAFLPAHPATLDVVWRMALSGAGFGLFQSPNNRTMIAAAPRERSGGASGMLGTARLLGQEIEPMKSSSSLLASPVSPSRLEVSTFRLHPCSISITTCHAACVYRANMWTPFTRTKTL